MYLHAKRRKRRRRIEVKKKRNETREAMFFKCTEENEEKGEITRVSG